MLVLFIFLLLVFLLPAFGGRLGWGLAVVERRRSALPGKRWLRDWRRADREPGRPPSQSSPSGEGVVLMQEQRSFAMLNIYGV